MYESLQDAVGKTDKKKFKAFKKYKAKKLKTI